MPWWVTSILFPIFPALIAIVAGWAYVSFPKAFYGATGQGQLFFVSAGLAGQSLTALSTAASDPLTVASLWTIFIMSVALFTAATIWKYREPPRLLVAGLIVVGGSVGMVLWSVSISVNILGRVG